MPPRANLPVHVCRLGRADYREVARLQRALRAAREAGAIDDTLLLVEHDPVITCGTRTEPHEVAHARTTGVPLVPVERGGKATYHGPGQVVAYPIFDLAVVDDDVKELVWRLEASIIAALAVHDLESDRRVGYPGVWVDLARARPRKIASVGLRLTRGVTFHGIAINVACDLTPFGWFTPCGIVDAEMTSLARELDLEDAPQHQLDMLVRSVEDSLASGIVQRFRLDAAVVEADELRAVASRFVVGDPAMSLPGEPRLRSASRVAVVEPVGALA